MSVVGSRRPRRVLAVACIGVALIAAGCTPNETAPTVAPTMAEAARVSGT